MHADCHIPFSRLRRTRLVRLGILLLLVIALVLAGYLTLSRLASENQFDGLVINIAGRQRTLAERYAPQTNLALVALSVGDWRRLVAQRTAASRPRRNSG